MGWFDTGADMSFGNGSAVPVAGWPDRPGARTASIRRAILKVARNSQMPQRPLWGRVTKMSPTAGKQHHTPQGGALAFETEIRYEGRTKKTGSD